MSGPPAPPEVSFVKPEGDDVEALMLWREQVANVRKHWVRAVTACSSRCLFCLDGDTPRNLYLAEEDVKAEILRGRTELDAWKIILSGGEASLHPLFPEFVSYARDVGYGRIQTVTNGWRYADRDFYETCIDAGLQELTFSLHGHTPELHNRLTRHPGAFERITKAIARAARDPRVICSVDVVINKQNVGVLDQIVQLAIKLGVTEFDLLHVIPQAWGFDHRDDLFYDPREHLPVLQKVFRLNRHPRFVVWTNRFPLPFLEGMEDLIQDPHKMIDELEAFKHDVRRYVDTGQPADCRQPERCVHCFNEPLCTTIDRAITRQHDATWDTWDVADDLRALRDVPAPLPYGIARVGVQLPTLADLPRVRLPSGAGCYLRVGDHAPLPADGPAGSVVVVATAAQADAWLRAPLPAWVDEIDLHLTRDVAPWLVDHAADVVALGARVRLHQPTHERLEQAKSDDVHDLPGLFAQLPRGLRVSGLPACLAPGATLIEARPILPATTFDRGTGRFDLPELARHHIVDGYRAKSSRCGACPVADRCDGAHVNMLRDQGFRILRPLTGAWAAAAAAQLTARWPEPPPRLATGAPALPAAPSLPGYADAHGVSPDPLDVAAAERDVVKAARRAQREAR